ncbi:transglutaminase family protein [Paenibacillus abyssi]|uniref:Transglutaminase-like domain-containing protein n=1 Tax=Paenibacillus abyssi TaxID=1340531 RepID=A0A917LHF9_9BACL|nr:transglutaminase domain-containing protein [Paenibacillus abyssi]GGG23938.1 hypothetical protein GCM10010916_45610 [Paenibacillus abyssi]
MKAFLNLAKSAPGDESGKNKRSGKSADVTETVYLPLTLRIVTSLLLFGLLVEWIFPLELFGHWTQLYRIGPLIAVAGFVLAIGILLPPWWLSFILNGSLCTISVMWLFYEGLNPVMRLSELTRTLQSDLAALASGSGGFVSGELRTLLLFTGSAMLVSALQSLVWVRYWGPGLAVLTAVYLLVIHWFTGADIHMGLLRVAGEGLLLTALITYMMAVRRYGSGVQRVSPIELHGMWPLRWWAAGLTSAVVLLAAAYGASWEKPRLSEPAAWTLDSDMMWELAALTGVDPQLRSIGETQRPGVRMNAAFSGYGFDDRRLGAPLVVDDSVVFTATSPAPLYWRGDSLEIYNGSGWEPGERQTVLLPIDEAMDGNKVADGSVFADQPAPEQAQAQQAGMEGSGIESIEKSKVTAAEEVMDRAEIVRQSAANEKETESGGAIQQTSPAENPGIDISASEKAMDNSRVTPQSVTMEEPGSEIPASEKQLKTSRMIQQTVTMARAAAGWPLFAGGSDVRVTSIIAGEPPRSLQSYRKNEQSEGVFAPAETVSIAAYTVESVITDPAHWTAGEKIAEYNQAGGIARDPSDLSAAYLQLPSTLPARVKELAEQIVSTAGDSRYEQAKAIESYLRGHFAYTLEGSRSPKAGDDFVDHFLFEQKQGYCVHFSTAMAVMLRTQGIPARWVKGFAPGELINDEASMLGTSGPGVTQAEQRYIIRGQDAHAWVEVFIPEAGWVSFDPTPGYDGAASAAAAIMSAAEGDAAGSSPAAGGDAASGPQADAARAALAHGGFAGRAYARLQAAAVQAAIALPRGAEALAERALGAGGRLAAAAADPAARRWAGAAAVAAALACAALAAAWRSRARFALALALRRYGRAYAAGRDARGRFLAVAHPCWRILYRQYGGRPPAMTAREYAGSLTLPAYGNQQLKDFVRWDEQARFGKEWPAPPPPDTLAATIKALLAFSQKRKRP